MDTLNICVDILAFQDNDVFTKGTIYLQRWDFIAYNISNNRGTLREILAPLTHFVYPSSSNSTGPTLLFRSSIGSS